MTNEESSSKVNKSSNVDTPVDVTSEAPSVSKEGMQNSSNKNVDVGDDSEDDVKEVYN